MLAMNEVMADKQRQLPDNIKFCVILRGVGIALDLAILVYLVYIHTQ